MKTVKILAAVAILLLSIVVGALLVYRVYASLDVEGLKDPKAGPALDSVKEIYKYARPLGILAAVAASILFFKRERQRYAIIAVLAVCVIGLVVNIALFTAIADDAMGGAAQAHPLVGVSGAEGWPPETPEVLVTAEDGEMFFRLPMVEDAVNGFLGLSIVWAIATFGLMAYMSVDVLLAPRGASEG